MKKYLKILRLIVLCALLIISAIGCVSTGYKPPEMDPGFCMACHQAASDQKSMVFPEKCGECHSKQVEEFRKSRHSVGWDRMRMGIFLLYIAVTLKPTSGEAFNPAAHIFIAERVFQDSSHKIDLYC